MQTTTCINCFEYKAQDSMSLCDDCFSEQNEELKKKIRDVETYDEDRLLFLVRVSEHFGLNQTKKDIKNKIIDGLSDEQILRSKIINVWQKGTDPSKALPYIYK